MEIKHNKSALKLRLIVALVMVILGFIGVVLTDIKKDGAWKYWRALCIIYTIISLALSWHLKKQGWKTSLFTLWHELAHWAGLIGAIFIASYFVDIGLIGRFEASIVILLLLALATYLVGIYTEATFIFIGIMLAGFAAAIAFLDAYLYNLILPITLIIGVLLVVFIHRVHKKTDKA